MIHDGKYKVVPPTLNRDGSHEVDMPSQQFLKLIKRCYVKNLKTHDIVLLIPSANFTNRQMNCDYKDDSSTSWVQGRNTTKVLSLEKEPGLKQVIPVYLKAFWSLLSPKTICTARSKDKRNLRPPKI